MAVFEIMIVLQRIALSPKALKYDISERAKKCSVTILAGFKDFKVESVCKALQEWGSLDPLQPQPTAISWQDGTENAAFLRRENPDKDQFSPRPP